MRKLQGRDIVAEEDLKPTISVVIEWENAKNSKCERASAMLRALTRQLDEARPRLGGAPELILVHDAEETTAADVLESVQDEITAFSGEVRTVSAEGLDYYEQKTLGATHASGDAILFVDSDVVPAPGWFAHLLDCYVQESADVVCGTTCIATDSLYERSFALFWFFPMKHEAGERRRTGHFFANNVLFRASVFREQPFPESDLVRGKCVQLAELLQERQKSIFIEPRAYVDHPAPNGVKHFVNRALCQGHDNVFSFDDRGSVPALKRCKRRLGEASRRIRRHHRAVGLSAPGAVAAMGIAAAYSGLELVGELATLASGPDRHLIRNHLRV